jgi:hypothetical protein
MGFRTGLDVVEENKNLPLPALELRPFGHPVASLYTDCAIPAPEEN